MQQLAESNAWLESAAGERTPLADSLSFGRARSNTIVLGEDNVSRRHAMIHLQGPGEFMLIDMGSSNGTYLNGRRVVRPCKLSDRDRIGIGNHSWVFRQPQTLDAGVPEAVTGGATLHNIESVACWLLVADIESSTQFAQALPAAEAPLLTSRWLADCKQLIEAHQGVINKFLGDGFLAYWRDTTGTAGHLLRALDELRQRQEQGQPRFRLVVHHGSVFVGGAASLGEESLLGNEVNFVFRMEKVAGAHGHARLVSAAAALKLGDRLRREDSFRRAVQGFEGEFEFHSF